jgi:hypothetical protein
MMVVAFPSRKMLGPAQKLS